MCMNTLPHDKRTQILAMLCEESSMRSISRVADVSINTVTKLLVDAGEVCLDLHDETVRNAKASRIQCDEIWSFCHAKLSIGVQKGPLLGRYRRPIGTPFRRRYEGRAVTMLRGVCRACGAGRA